MSNDKVYLTFHFGRLNYKIAIGRIPGSNRTIEDIKNEYIMNFITKFGNSEFIKTITEDCKSINMSKKWIKETLAAVKSKEYYFQVFDYDIDIVNTFDKKYTPKMRYMLLKDRLDENHVLKTAV